MKKIFLHLLPILLSSIFLTFPFFRETYFPTHDGEWAIVRLGAMHRALIDHHFPVRWTGNQNFGFGYPLFEFTYPFPYYLGEIFNLGGLSLISSVKMVFVLSVLVSGISMFFLAREFFGNFGGLLSSIFFIFAPYRIVNLYVRGSLGESLSLVFFPLLFLLLVKIYKKPNSFYVVLFSLLFGILLLTHNITALVFAPLLIAFSLFLLLKHKNKTLLAKNLLIGFSLGILLASFFLIPALTEKKYIALSETRISDIKEHFVSLDKLVLPYWNYGAYGTKGSFSPQLGWVHLIALFVSFVVLYLIRKKKYVFQTPLFFLTSLFILIFLMLPQSLFFWEKVPLFSDVDFPWRLLTPVIFLISFPLGALSLNRYTSLLGLVLLVLVVLVNISYATPRKYINTNDAYYFTNEATTTSKDELMPIWVSEKPTKRSESKIEILDGNAKIINIIQSNSVKTKFEIEADSRSKLRLNTIYFPGWEIKNNGKPINFTYANSLGVMEFTLPKGNHIIEARFTETPLRISANILSLISLAVIVFFLIKGRIKFK